LKRALLGVGALAFAACVSPGQYQSTVDERDALEQRIQQEEASVQALTAERDRLAGELEDLRIAHEPLARNAEKLQGIEERLPACEAEVADRTAKLEQLQTTYEGLVKDLEGEVAANNTKIDQLREGLRISLSAELLFNSGSADLSDEGTGVLTDLGQDLRAEKYVPYQILVEGHTDGVAIRGPLAERYPTNWELAGARAARVVRALEDAGVDGARLAAVSRGQGHPVGPDDTPEGRAANRRIEIRLIPNATVPPAEASAPSAEPANPAPPAQ
jgi:chemotaxis protein MotB